MSLYNDQSPLVPGEYAVGPRSEVHFRALLPNKRYPFPTHVPVVRGRVEDAGGEPASRCPNRVTDPGSVDR